MLATKATSVDFVEYFNKKWNQDPFNSNNLYFALHVQSIINRWLTFVARLQLFSQFYIHHVPEIKDMGLIAKLLVLYYGDKMIAQRPNTLYVRLLYDNLFKLFKHLNDESNLPTYSDMYEKKSVLALLLNQTDNFVRESQESKQYLDKYKKMLLDYFLKRLDFNVSNVHDFKNLIGCVSLMTRTLGQKYSFKIDTQEQKIKFMSKLNTPSFSTMLEKKFNDKHQFKNGIAKEHSIRIGEFCNFHCEFIIYLLNNYI